MCDQLWASAGVAFDLDRAASLFTAGLRWSAAHPFPCVPGDHHHHHPPAPWASADLFPAGLAAARGDDRSSDVALDAGTDDVGRLWETARPWGLGQTRAPASLLQKALGRSVRRPGTFVRVDEDTNGATREPLLGTGEAVHSSVRVRLACGGLGLDDEAVWTCEALTGADHRWRLERSGEAGDAGEGDAASARSADEEIVPRTYAVRKTDGAWRWTYVEPAAGGEASDDTVPQSAVLPEEPLAGPCERLLLALTVGRPDVWRYAENKDDL